MRFGDRLAFTASSEIVSGNGVNRVLVLVNEDGSSWVQEIRQVQVGNAVGTVYGSPTGLTAIGDDLYFAANGAFPIGRELYMFDSDFEGPSKV